MSILVALNLGVRPESIEAECCRGAILLTTY
jgi:hypothetical protein